MVAPIGLVCYSTRLTPTLVCHSSLHILSCIVNPMCTDSAKESSKTSWANTRSTHVGDTMEQLLSCCVWGPFSVSSHFMVDGCQQNNYVCLCIWSKYQIADDIAFPLSTMMRVINKCVSEHNNGSRGGFSASSFPICLSELDMSIFFWVTANIEVLPSAPSKGNTSSWVQDSVLTRPLSCSCSLQSQMTWTSHVMLVMWIVLLV